MQTLFLLSVLISAAAGAGIGRVLRRVHVANPLDDAVRLRTAARGIFMPSIRERKHEDEVRNEAMRCAGDAIKLRLKQFDEQQAQTAYRFHRHHPEILQPLIDVVERTTGKRVLIHPDDWVVQDTEHIIIPALVRPLMHELSHWLIASDEERAKSNLGLEGGAEHRAFCDAREAEVRVVELQLTESAGIDWDALSGSGCPLFHWAWQIGKEGPVPFPPPVRELAVDDLVLREFEDALSLSIQRAMDCWNA